MPNSNLVVLGTIRAPRLGVLTITQNIEADAWQIQLRQESGKEGALMTIAIVDGKVVHRKHEDFEEQKNSVIHRL